MRMDPALLRDSLALTLAPASSQITLLDAQYMHSKIAFKQMESYQSGIQEQGLEYI